MGFVKKLLDISYKSGAVRCRLVIYSSNKLVFTAYEPLSCQLFSKWRYECYCNDVRFLDAGLRSFYDTGDISALLTYIKYGEETYKFYRHHSKFSHVRHCPI